MTIISIIISTSILTAVITATLMHLQTEDCLEEYNKIYSAVLKVLLKDK